MKEDSPHNHPPEASECPRRRLAQGSLAAVDGCRCGMLQVHLGAITLRMTPGALAELAATLNDAVVVHARELVRADELPTVLGSLRQERGEA